MDIILGVGSVGSYLNNHEAKTQNLAYGKYVKRRPINGLNIYDSNNYRENKNMMDDVAYVRYKLSENPKESGIIPNFYNQLQAVQKRNEERNKKIALDQKKRNDIILTEQKTNVENRTVLYKQIILFGILPCILLLIFIQLTL